MSDIWEQLVEHEIDILVCTTIIETGVDVPNVNTLVIEDSDRFRTLSAVSAPWKSRTFQPERLRLFHIPA